MSFDDALLEKAAHLVKRAESQAKYTAGLAARQTMSNQLKELAAYYGDLDYHGSELANALIGGDAALIESRRAQVIERVVKAMTAKMLNDA